MAIEKELLDQLLEGRDPETVFTQDGLLDELKKGLSERVLNAELDAHLDAETADGKTNRHNGRSQKTVLTGTSKVTLDIPRDRAGTFDPQLIAKYQRRFPDFDEKIISMYARGMTVREIRGHLQELYGIEVSPDLISTVTDAVLEAVSEWQNRPLDACYAIVFFDAIRVKIRDEGFVRNKAVYIALAILPDGTKEILGLWIEQTEGAKFWLRVMNVLKNRSVQDILLAVVDGLKGFSEAINATFPETVVQTCIVHLIRQSMNFASWKDRKHVAKALRDVYRAKDADAGLAALDAFEAGPWGEKYPAIHRAGGATGNTSRPSLSSPRRYAGLSTPQTPSSRSTPRSGALSAPAATSPVTRPPQSCYISFSIMRPRRGNVRRGNGTRPKHSSPSSSAKGSSMSDKTARAQIF